MLHHIGVVEGELVLFPSQKEEPTALGLFVPDLL